MPGLETGLVMRLLTGISGKTAGMVAERVALTDSCRPCLYPPCVGARVPVCLCPAQPEALCQREAFSGRAANRAGQ